MRYESDLVLLQAICERTRSFSPKIERVYTGRWKNINRHHETAFTFGSGERILVSLVCDEHERAFFYFEKLNIGGREFLKPTLSDVEVELREFLGRQAHLPGMREQPQGNVPNLGRKPQEEGTLPTYHSLPRGNWIRRPQLQSGAIDGQNPKFEGRQHDRRLEGKPPKPRIR